MTDYNGLSKEALEILKKTGVVIEGSNTSVDFLCDSYLLAEKGMTVADIRKLPADDKVKYAEEMAKFFSSKSVFGELPGGEKEAKENVRWYGAFFRKAVAKLKDSGISFPEKKQLESLKGIKALEGTDFMYAAEYSRRFLIYTQPLTEPTARGMKTETNPYGIVNCSEFVIGYGGVSDSDQYKKQNFVGNKQIYAREMSMLQTMCNVSMAREAIGDKNLGTAKRAYIKSVLELQLVKNLYGKSIGNASLDKYVLNGTDGRAWLGTTGLRKYGLITDEIGFDNLDLSEEELEATLSEASENNIKYYFYSDKTQKKHREIMEENHAYEMVPALDAVDYGAKYDVYDAAVKEEGVKDTKPILTPGELSIDRIKSLSTAEVALLAKKFDEIFDPILIGEQAFKWNNDIESKSYNAFLLYCIKIYVPKTNEETEIMSVSSFLSTVLRKMNDDRSDYEREKYGKAVVMCFLAKDRITYYPMSEDKGADVYFSPSEKHCQDIFAITTKDTLEDSTKKYTDKKKKEVKQREDRILKHESARLELEKNAFWGIEKNNIEIKADAENDIKAKEKAGAYTEDEILSKMNFEDFIAEDQKTAMEKLKQAGLQEEEPTDMRGYIISYALAEKHYTIDKLYKATADEKKQIGADFLKDVTTKGNLSDEKGIYDGITWYAELLSKALSVIKSDKIDLPKTVYDPVKNVEPVRRTKFWLTNLISTIFKDSTISKLMNDSTGIQPKSDAVDKKPVMKMDVFKKAYGENYQSDCVFANAVTTIGASFFTLYDTDLSKEDRVKVKLVGELYVTDIRNMPDYLNKEYKNFGTFLERVNASKLTGFKGLFTDAELDILLSTPLRELKKSSKKLYNKAKTAVERAVKRAANANYMDSYDLKKVTVDRLEDTYSFIKDTGKLILSNELLGDGFYKKSSNNKYKREPADKIAELRASYKVNGAKAKYYGNLAKFFSAMEELTDVTKVDIKGVCDRNPEIAYLLDFIKSGLFMEPIGKSDIFTLYEEICDDRERKQAADAYIDMVSAIKDVIVAERRTENELKNASKNLLNKKKNLVEILDKYGKDILDGYIKKPISKDMWSVGVNDRFNCMVDGLKYSRIYKSNGWAAGEKDVACLINMLRLSVKSSFDLMFSRASSGDKEALSKRSYYSEMFSTLPFDARLDVKVLNAADKVFYIRWASAFLEKYGKDPAFEHLTELIKRFNDKKDEVLKTAQNDIKKELDKLKDMPDQQLEHIVKLYDSEKFASKKDALSFASDYLDSLPEESLCRLYETMIAKQASNIVNGRGFFGDVRKLSEVLFYDYKDKVYKMGFGIPNIQHERDKIIIDTFSERIKGQFRYKADDGVYAAVNLKKYMKKRGIKKSYLERTERKVFFETTQGDAYFFHDYKSIYSALDKKTEKSDVVPRFTDSNAASYQIAEFEFLRDKKEIRLDAVEKLETQIYEYAEKGYTIALEALAFARDLKGDAFESLRESLLSLADFNKNKTMIFQMHKALTRIDIAIDELEKSENIDKKTLNKIVKLQEKWLDILDDKNFPAVNYRATLMEMSVLCDNAYKECDAERTKDQIEKVRLAKEKCDKAEEAYRNLLDEKQKSEQEKQDEAIRREQERRAEDERREQERKAEEKRRAEEERLALERFNEEERREEERREQERKAKEERREQERKAEEEKREQERKAEEEKLAKERQAEEKRLARIKAVDRELAELDAQAELIRDNPEALKENLQKKISVLKKKYTGVRAKQVKLIDKDKKLDNGNIGYEEFIAIFVNKHTVHKENGNDTQLMNAMFNLLPENTSRETIDSIAEHAPFKITDMPGLEDTFKAATKGVRSNKTNKDSFDYMNNAFDVITEIEDLKKEKNQITKKKESKQDIIDPNEDNIIRTDVEREDNIIRTDVEHEDNIIEKEEPIIIKEDNEEIIDDRNNFEPLVDIKAPDGFEMVEHKNEVDIVLNLQRRDSKNINDTLNKNLGKCKNYSDVFRAVSKRKGIALGHKEIVIHASYALAAVQLEKEGVKYSLKTLKSRAKSIRTNYLSNQEYMEKYTDRKLQQSFSTKMGSEHLNRHIVNDIYGVFDRAKMKQYKKDMEKLLFNMMNAENPEVRSREYQRLMRSVKLAAEITLNNNDVLGNIEKIADANFELLAAAFNYMDDKKKVRSSWDGKARFENALDALAVVRKYASGTKSIIDKYVDSINEKRGTQNRMARWHVDITEFGADNAEAKELAREGDKKLGKMDMFIHTKNKRFVEIKEPEDNPAPQEKKKTSLLEE